MKSRRMPFLVAIYLWEILKGMGKTLGFFLFKPRFTTQYPEQKMPEVKGYRGEHRLKKDAQGRPKCVACFMCATACPSLAITIEAAPAPWPDRDKVPRRFEIDLLRCIFCGFCEEACPCDAIELTPKHPQIATTRGAKIYDMDRLLSN